MTAMKGRQLIRRLKAAGVEIEERRGKGGHYLAPLPRSSDGDSNSWRHRSRAGLHPQDLQTSSGSTQTRSSRTRMQPYPLTLDTDDNGTTIAQAMDVPEAITVGRDALEAVARAEDALVAALRGYIDDGRAIPRPSRPKRGQPCANLPRMVAAKLAIYQAMRAAGLSQAMLAERLGCDPRQVRRLLDLDHRSRLDQLEAALAALGKRLVLEVQDAA
jgi:antitoxin HicB